MDAVKLRQIFGQLDQALEHPTELLIRGGAAALAHGLEQRVTLDVDVLPASSFVEMDLRRACAAAGLDFNPSEKDFVERFRLTRTDLEEAFERLPARLKADPVVQDNLRFVIEDYL